MQTFGGAESVEGDGNFMWSDGPVLCMLATHAGPDRRITLYAVTADKRLVISSYPVLHTDVFRGRPGDEINCIVGVVTPNSSIFRRNHFLQRKQFRLLQHISL